MAIETLKDVYINQLQDVYSADQQSRDATQKLADLATDKDLKAALERGVNGIQTGIDAVESIIRKHGADPKNVHCKGMEGIVNEAHAHVINADVKDDDARDAMIITQYQRMTHYGLAVYGCVAAFARRLGLKEEAARLQTCLDNTYDGDRQMTLIAERDVNEAATA